MHSTVGIDHLSTDELATWQARLTEELAADFDSRPLSTNAERFGRRMLAQIETALNRRSYDPRTKKPPKPARASTAVERTNLTEAAQS